MYSIEKLDDLLKRIDKRLRRKDTPPYSGKLLREASEQLQWFREEKLCASCRHWERRRDFAYGVCRANLGNKVDILNFSGGLDCIVETDDDFSCFNYEESESSKLANN